jgi:actin-like ATPase involved in cell morphogenesis
MGHGEVMKMGILSGVFSDNLAIDLGTVNTLVYAPTQGIVLNESRTYWCVSFGKT